ncbi:MAG: S-layer homology domain-containing protein [Bacillota bacterium]
MRGRFAKSSRPGQETAGRGKTLVSVLLVFCLLAPGLFFPSTARAATGWQSIVIEAGTGLNDVAYGEGQYAAVGAGGAIFTSPDGSAWTPQTSGTTQSLLGVAYGGGRFVAVGYGGTILASEDGATWSPQSGGAGALLSDVTYGGGQFVAVGSAAGSAIILTSPDGLAWSAATPPPGFGELVVVAYGAGVYAVSGPVIASEGVSLAASSDLVTWNVYGDGSLPYIRGAAYGEGQFVMVGNDALAFTSSDGQVWTERDTGALDYLEDVTYGAGEFVAVGWSGHMATSPDGLTWTGETPAVSSDLSGIAFGDRFVAVAWDGTGLLSDPPDTAPPAWGPGAGLSATSVGRTGLTLTWTPATDNHGVVAYAVYRGGTQIASVSGSSLTYAVTGLTPGTVYAFKVEAGDAQGNWSTDGPAATAKTSNAPRREEVPLCPEQPGVTCAVIDPSRHSIVRESGGGFVMEIPAGAIDGPPGPTVRILVTTVTPSEAGGLWPATAPPFIRYAGRTYRIQAQLLATGQEITAASPSHPVLFLVPVSPADLPPGLGPEKLGLFRVGGNPDLWFAGGRPTQGQLAAELTAFGHYTLAAVDVTFPDLAGHWSRPDVELMASKRVVAGLPGGLFGPDEPVTRAQFAAMLVRAVGRAEADRAAEGTADTPASAFSDVRPGDWFYAEVLAAAGRGVVRGMEDGTFRPDDPVTREQAAAMLVRALRAGGRLGDPPDAAARQALLGAFEDRATVSGWAVDDLAVALHEQVVRGQMAARLAPRDGATRAEAAVMLARFWRKWGGSPR